MKKILLLSLSVIAAMSATADPVSQSKAKSIALSFMKAQKGAKTTVVLASDGTKANRAKGASGMTLSEPAYYAFNANNGGYVLVSGDDCMPSILAYSDKNSWSNDSEAMPPMLKDGLEHYAQYIDDVRSGKVAAPASSVTSIIGTPVVGPLIKTEWNQTFPYNAYEPEIVDSVSQAALKPASYGKFYPTGCAATALSQVLNYWQVKHPTDCNTYYTIKNEVTGVTKKYTTTLSSATTYDLDNMPVSILQTPEKSYMTNEEWVAKAKAVAQLNRDASFALNMDFDHEGGGAGPFVMQQAVIKAFGMTCKSQTVRAEGQSTLCKREYMDLIKSDLNHHRPILIGGTEDTGGGHEIIIDGYDDQDFVHINYGWGGENNGWVSPAFLNHVCINVVFVYNVQPAEEGETVALSDNTIFPGALNFGSGSIGIDRDMANLIYKEDRDSAHFIYYADKEKTPLTGWAISNSCLSTLGFDYDYKLTITDPNGETYNVDLTDSITKQDETTVNTQVTLNENLGLTNLVDGLYKIDGQMRQTLNGVADDWFNLGTDSILVSGNDIIFSPEEVGDWCHAANCYHYQIDADNKMLIHLDYQDFPAQSTIVYLFNVMALGNEKMNYVYPDKSTRAAFVAIAPSGEAALIKDVTDDMNQFIKNAQKLGSASLVAAPIFRDSQIPGNKTFKLAFMWPAMGVDIQTDWLRSGEPTAVQSVQAQELNSAKSQTYNLLGQPVGDNYRGVVIRNGKVFMK